MSALKWKKNLKFMFWKKTNKRKATKERNDQHVSSDTVTGDVSTTLHPEPTDRYLITPVDRNDNNNKKKMTLAKAPPVQMFITRRRSEVINTLTTTYPLDMKDELWPWW